MLVALFAVVSIGSMDYLTAEAGARMGETAADIGDPNVAFELGDIEPDPYDPTTSTPTSPTTPTTPTTSAPPTTTAPPTTAPPTTAPPGTYIGRTTWVKSAKETGVWYAPTWEATATLSLSDTNGYTLQGSVQVRVKVTEVRKAGYWGGRDETLVSYWDVTAVDGILQLSDSDLSNATYSQSVSEIRYEVTALTGVQAPQQWDARSKKVTIDAP